MPAHALLGLVLAASAPEAARTTPEATGEVVRRYAAPEARQGVAVGKRLFYAIDNSRIGAHDKRSGARLFGWEGDPALFPHLNSCSLVRRELVCASSNYPAVPMSSSIEYFDARTLKHKRSRSLGPGTGSLTWIDWHKGSWWAGFANYDGKGGEAGRDHRFTTLVRFDRHFRRTGAWLFPATVLEAFKPYSSSGGVWGAGGRLYVTGHDRPEVYVVTLPEAGSTLVHVGTIGVSTAGQAIDWSGGNSPKLWSINRASREVVETSLPAN